MRCAREQREKLTSGDFYNHVRLRFLPCSGARPPLLGETGNPWDCNSFKKRWNAFVRKAGFAGTRPYALRHTFAIINLARGENIKTVSVLLGHADASYTLDLYVGFIPAATRGLANRYVGRLVPGLVDGGGKHGLKEDFR